MIDKTGFVDIPGYEGLYAINRNGDVYSYRRKRLLKHNLQKGWPSDSGRSRYFRVGLTKNGKFKDVKIHVLLAKIFIPNPQNLPEVNHKNGIKTDIAIENLEWVTHLGNMKHANETSLFDKSLQRKNGRKMGLGNKKISFKDAEEIRRLYKTGKYTQRKLAEMYGVCLQNINCIVLNKTQLMEACI